MTIPKYIQLEKQLLEISSKKDHKAVVDFILDIDDDDLAIVVNNIEALEFPIDILNLLIMSNRTRLQSSIKIIEKIIRNEIVLNIESYSSEIQFGYLSLLQERRNDFLTIEPEVDSILNYLNENVLFSAIDNLKVFDLLTDLASGMVDLLLEHFVSGINKDILLQMIVKKLELQADKMIIQNLCSFVRAFSHNSQMCSISDCWAVLKAQILKRADALNLDEMYHAIRICLFLSDALGDESWIYLFRNILNIAHSKLWGSFDLELILWFSTSKNATQLLESIQRDIYRGKSFVSITDAVLLSEILRIKHFTAEDFSQQGLFRLSRARHALFYQVIYSLCYALGDTGKVIKASLASSRYAGNLSTKRAFDWLEIISYWIKNAESLNEKAIAFGCEYITIIFHEIPSVRTEILGRSIQNLQNTNGSVYETLLCDLVRRYPLEISEHSEVLQTWISPFIEMENLIGTLIKLFVPLIKVSPGFGDFVMISLRKMLGLSLKLKEVSLYLMCFVMSQPYICDNQEEEIAMCIMEIMDSSMSYVVFQTICNGVYSIYNNFNTASISVSTSILLHKALLAKLLKIFVIQEPSEIKGKRRQLQNDYYVLKPDTFLEPVDTLLPCLLLMENVIREYSPPELDYSMVAKDVFMSLLRWFQMPNFLDSFLAEKKNCTRINMVLNCMCLTLNQMVESSTFQNASSPWILLQQLHTIVTLHPASMQNTYPCVSRKTLFYFLEQFQIENTCDDPEGRCLVLLLFTTSVLRHKLKLAIHVDSMREEHHTHDLAIILKLAKKFLLLGLESKTITISSCNICLKLDRLCCLNEGQENRALSSGGSKKGNVVVNIRVELVQILVTEVQRTVLNSGIAQAEADLSQSLGSASPLSKMAMSLLQTAVTHLEEESQISFSLISIITLSVVKIIASSIKLRPDMDDIRDIFMPKIAFDLLDQYPLLATKKKIFRSLIQILFHRRRSILQMFPDVFKIIKASFGSASSDIGKRKRLRSTIDSSAYPVADYFSSANAAIAMNAVHSTMLLWIGKWKKEKKGEQFLWIIELLSNVCDYCNAIESRTWLDESFYLFHFRLWIRIFRIFSQSPRSFTWQYIYKLTKSFSGVDELSNQLNEVSSNASLLKAISWLRCAMDICKMNIIEFSAVEVKANPNESEIMSCLQLLQASEVKAPRKKLPKMLGNALLRDSKHSSKSHRLKSVSRVRIRSRNSYIDSCLREEEGIDAFADLEDFIEV